MIVLCDGMQRSASTWAFNVVLKLIGQSYPAAAIYSGYQENLGESLQTLGPAYEHLILKGHTLDPCARFLARAGAIKSVYTHRDPYDAIVSCMRMFNMPFEVALAAITQSLEVWDFHASTGTACVVAYEAITNRPQAAVQEIATYLDLPLEASVLERIAAETGIDRMRELSNWSEESAAAAARHEDLSFNRETLLHRNHIRDGGSGYGARLLTAEQRLAVDQILLGRRGSALSGPPATVPICQSDAEPGSSGSAGKVKYKPAGNMLRKVPAWASELAWLSKDDRHLPASLDAVNLVLNRARLAAFLGQFAEDKDVRDLLALDLLGTTAGLPLSSTGLAETMPSLASRPFRLWEYVWLYKVLGLSAGGMKVLDLGGPATQLSILAAIAGCDVTSVDINPEFVRAAEECARALKLPLLKARVGDMRDLSQFPAASFDIVISCSVLEHLTPRDQSSALKQIARVLKPTGLVGLTVDYGPPAPGANQYLPPPHAPPESAAGAVRRYSQGGLAPVGNSLSEDPIPGCLFRHDRIHYTVASLFLAKAGQRDVTIPRCELAGSALGRLVIRELPYRVYKGIERTGALIDHLRSTAAQLERNAAERLVELGRKEAAFGGIAAEAERRREQLEQAVSGIGEREERIAGLESTAAERLAAMEDRDREIQAREQRIAKLESTAAERLAAMQDRDREIQAREQRIAKLESTAAERLAAMQDRDLLISRLHAEIESRDHAIQEIARRADALESTADEHLAPLVARDQVIATLQTERQALHESLEAALAAIAEGQTRAAALEQDMEQMTALQSSLEVERASLIREKDTLSQHISRLEKEGLRDYLFRRYNRDRPKPRRGKAR